MRMPHRVLAITAALCAGILSVGAGALPALAQDANVEAPVELQASQTKTAYDFFKAQGSNTAAGILNGTVGPRKMKDGTYLHNYTNLGDADDATSLANMLEALDMLEEMNKVRTQVEHVSELKVTDTAMAYTMLAANWTNDTYENGGGLQHSNPSALSDTMRWGNSRGEVIARGYRDARHVIGGWYWAEKAYATGTSQTDLYGTTYSTTENRQTGHYKIIRDNTYKIAGAAIVSDNNIRAVDFADVNRLLGAGSHTGTVSGEKTYTVSQYRARLQSYIDQVGGIDEPEPEPEPEPVPDTPSGDYKVIVAKKGEVEVRVGKAAPGEVLHFSVIPAEGWQFDRMYVDAEGGTPLVIHSGERDEDYWITMPEANVIIQVFCSKIEYEPWMYPSITVEIEGAEGGYMNVPSSAKPDTVVSGSIVTNDGWWLYSATAEAGGRDIVFQMDVDDGGLWKFAMPHEDVTIKLVFMPYEDEPEEPEPEEPDKPVETPKPNFSDVADDAWYAGSVAWAVESGAMGGYSGTNKFGPDDTLTRAQMAQVLWSLEGKPSVTVNAGDLPSDVKTNEWYASSVTWSLETGVFAGYDDGTYGPENALTREQAAVVLWRRSGEPASNQSLSAYRDGDKTSSFAVAAMRWAIEEGVLSGKDQADGSKLLCPQDTCTRAELATMLMRMDNEGKL